MKILNKSETTAFYFQWNPTGASAHFPPGVTEIDEVTYQLLKVRIDEEPMLSKVELQEINEPAPVENKLESLNEPASKRGRKPKEQEESTDSKEQQQINE